MSATARKPAIYFGSFVVTAQVHNESSNPLNGPSDPRPRSSILPHIHSLSLT